MGKEIVIHTGLEGFVMLDSIREVSASHIVGTCSISGVPVYLRLESLAQLGAYHIRSITDFSRHVFLLKIIQCRLPQGNITEGEYTLTGDLLGQSTSSFHCRLKAERDSITVMEGEFLYAAVDYDHNFQSDRLRHHYAKVFSCLQRDIKTD
jgi:hypothetical protein